MARNLDRLLRDYIAPPPGVRPADFAAPAGAPALFAPDSVSWRVMKNPVALIIGGIAAVILELAEPRVRTGVWEHTSFRRDPVTRMRRTGYAAWVTIYASAENARSMIAGVVRAHERVEGRTAAGAPYRANDPELLTWVHATAAFGFSEAYSRYVRTLTPAEIDAFHTEGAPAAALYGADQPPRSAAELQALFARMAPKLERSDIVLEFFSIVRAAPLLPVKALQRLVVRAAISITPDWARETLGLGREFALRRGEHTLVRALGAASDRFVLEDAPPAQACIRLGLPANYLYR
ncbi:oxygenase MpaB family protein [Candidatus Viadribacter manganicus]|uniref:Histidine kinase n=1 Tax=Candidatus Viadribacter manganicus TaxID=1759059 RepID=A0A1B1AI04_9PROT|nr:oxygenase MpaB family protein [Candidatus Viadribacter manganicus]ANP46171.1 histidine kinase [Candidatus Viadribacter manganicus]